MVQTRGMTMRLALVLLVVTVSASFPAARGQGGLSAGALVDTVLSWETYGDTRRARVRLYAADDERRPRTVVVDDYASDHAPVTDDVRFFVEITGRRLGFDPAECTFVFRFTAASFQAGAPDAGRRLLLRATFRRTESGELGPPAWRVIAAEGLEDLTSRQLR
jgi:hypothetical protein